MHYCELLSRQVHLDVAQSPPPILEVHSSPGKALLLEIQTLEAGLLFSSSLLHHLPRFQLQS